MKLFFILFLVSNLISNFSLAETQSFYSQSNLNKIKDTTIVDSQLKNILHEIEKQNQFNNTYREARWHLYTNIYLDVDKQGTPYVLDVYCEKIITQNVSSSSLPRGSKTNIEHTWPQSKFSNEFDKQLQKTDLHHLFITNSKANHLRGHQHFGEVSSFYTKKGRCKNSGLGILVKPPVHVAWSSDDFYQPPAFHRGNIARALFYFATRYQLKINNTQEYFLKKWHKEDPVTEKDILRNNRIERVQGNRNPFIDFPELVERIKDF